MPFTAFALALTLAFTIALTIAFTLTTLRPHPHPHLTRTASPCPSIPPLQLVKLTEAGLCGASSKHFVHEKCKVDLLSGGGSSDGAKVEAEMEVEVEDVAKVEAPRGAMSKVRCPRCVSLREALHKGAGAPRAQAAAVPPISATQHRYPTYHHPVCHLLVTNLTNHSFTPHLYFLQDRLTRTLSTSPSRSLRRRSPKLSLRRR